MTDRLTIALAQMSQSVGDLDGNAAAILAMRDRAGDADLLMVPELQLTGYPPEDLVLKPEFVRRTMDAAERLVDATATPGPAILFGSIVREDGANYNAMLLADGGKLIGRTLKRELPNYGTFDEKRVFASGPLPEPLEFRGIRLGVPICEDIWAEPVCAHLAEADAELLLVPNGSPYELDKDELRQRLVRSRVTMTGLPLVYLNRVGGQDETGLRRLVVRRSSRRRAGRADARLGRAIADHRVGARDGWLALPYPRRAPARSVSGGRLPGDGRGLARLCDAQRLPRRDSRPVGGHRQRTLGRRRGRRARAPTRSGA